MNALQDQEYEIQKLNLLAFPRNFQPLCELTGNNATVQLVTQHCTLYYATSELAEQAWFGIINKIAHLIAPLMLPAPIVGTQEERIRRANNVTLSKKSLIEFCMSEAAKLLSTKKYKLAIPAAIQALKYSKDVDGENAVSVVDPYLHLAEAFLGLNQISQAEEYLSFARWIVLNSTGVLDRTASKLYQLLGRINFARANYEGAKKDFAQSIFYSSRASGAEAIPTSLVYYCIGEVFLTQGNIEHALAFYDKVVDIWYKYLSGLHTSREAEKNNSNFSNINIKQSSQALLEEYIAEGHTQVEKILDCRKRLLGPGHIATGEAEYTLGLLEFFLMNNDQGAEILVLAAQRCYESQLGIAHPSTIHVNNILDMIQQQISLKNTM